MRSPERLDRPASASILGQRVLIVAAIVVIGLAAHVLVGFVPFPMGDDFTYGPLAWLALNPDAYPRDEHLRLYADHAFAYALVYRVSLATIGVAEGFLLATIILSVLMVAAMYAVVWVVTPDMSDGRRIGAVLMALAVSVLAEQAGVGRGGFGGFLSWFFHHQLISLVFALFACAATLGRRGALAGLFLGLAAYAQPASAIQASLAVGLGFLALGRGGLRPLLTAIAVAAIVAFPAVLRLAVRVMADGGTDIDVETIIEEGYRFRAPHHYNLPLQDYLLWAGYLVLGWVAATVLRRHHHAVGRVALGMMAAGGVLFALAFAIYGFGLLQWPIFFMLDLNRTTPLFFTLACLFAASAIILGLRDGDLKETPLALAPPAIGLTLFLANFTVAAVVTLIFGTWMMCAAHATRRPLALFIIATTAFVVIVLPVRHLELGYRPRVVEALTWVRENTPEDALFIIPVGLFEFRELSRRSAYVDFKTFSVAQPEHAAMTRNRMVEVAQPRPETLDHFGGFWAMTDWEADQHAAATCVGMMALMEQTGADYTVLRTMSRMSEPVVIPECADLPVLVFRDDALAVFSAKP